jgi:MFS family permease
MFSLLVAFSAGDSLPGAPGVGLVAFGAAAVLLLGFGYQERRARAPLLPGSLFRNSIFRRAVAASLLAGIGFWTALTFVPLHLQAVQGRSAEASGVLLVPFMVAHVLAAMLAGQLVTRTGRYRGVAASGGMIAAGGLLVLLAAGPRATTAVAAAAVVLIGAGTGVIMPVCAVLVQGSFPYRVLGTANAARLFFVNLGTVVGVPALTAVMMLPLLGSPWLLERIDLSSVAAAHPDVRMALENGLAVVYALAALSCVASALLAFRMPDMVLSDTFVE